MTTATFRRRVHGVRFVTEISAAEEETRSSADLSSEKPPGGGMGASAMGVAGSGTAVQAFPSHHRGPSSGLELAYQPGGAAGGDELLGESSKGCGFVGALMDLPFSY